MNSIISKRQEYADRLNSINVQIAKDVADYNKELHDEIELKVEKFRSDKIAENAIEIDILQKRIAMLDEMIKEEMPNAKELEEKIQQPEIIEEPIVEEPKIEVQETIIEETPIIEETIVEQEVEPIIEESKEEIIEEPIQEAEPIQEIEEVQKIEEVQEPVIEEVQEPIIENNIAAQSLERPGMSSIVLPVRE